MRDRPSRRIHNTLERGRRPKSQIDPRGCHRLPRGVIRRRHQALSAAYEVLANGAAHQVDQFLFPSSHTPDGSSHT